MTTTQVADQRFAWIEQHAGPVVDWSDPHTGHRHHVVGEGLAEWFASNSGDHDKPLSLSKHVDAADGTRMLELRMNSHDPSGVEPMFWCSTLKVAEGRYVRATGSAADFPTALEQVETHVHECRQFGGLTWWSESRFHWISWLGEFSLSATHIESSTKEPYWHFEVRGQAPTLEEAALLAVLGRSDMNSAGGVQGA